MSDTLKVLMLSKACVVGTYQRKLEEMARLDGVVLRVLVPPGWRDPDRGMIPLERAHVAGYDLRVTPIRFNGSFHFNYYPQFGRELRDFQPDVVHIDEEPYNLATWHALWHTRRARVRSLFFSWQNIARTYPLPFRWGERWTLKHIDYAIMGTQSAADVWRQKGYTGPLAVIPQFGVDPDQFAPPAPPAGPHPFTVGYAGRLTPEKGVDHLVEALAQLEGDWRLRIIGDGAQKAALQALADRLGVAERVTFGSLPSTEMPGFYQGLDVLALPSLTRPNWKEQFGRVITEAMACGVPVIGSDSGAIPGVIGDGGLTFPEGDVFALAERLRTLMYDAALRQTLGARGRARVLDHFTQAQVAAQTVAAYRDLLAATRPSKRRT